MALEAGRMDCEEPGIDLDKFTGTGADKMNKRLKTG